VRLAAFLVSRKPGTGYWPGVPDLRTKCSAGKIWQSSGTRLSMMSQTAVEDFYCSAHMVCRIGPGHFANARAIRELVQAWKQMRKWRRIRTILNLTRYDEMCLA
jgi:hypothetical protein